jgi:hypothetical protein
MRRGRQSRQWPKRILALGAAVVAVAALVLLTALYNHRAPVRSGHIVSLELGGRDNAATLIQRYGTARLRSTIEWDFAFIAGYGAALLIGAGLAIWLTWQETMRRYLPIGLALAVITILADLAENLFLLLGLGGHPKLGPANVYDACAVAATVKFCALVPAAVLAAIGVALALVRGLTFPRRVTVAKPAEVWPARPMDLQQASHSNLPPDPADGASARWLRGYHLPCCTGQPRPAPKDGEVTGVGLSGGGIRAASLGLGALQSPGMRSVLSHAQYLVSVSGGGYTAGALAQALAEPEPRLPRNHKVIRDPGTVFAVGSPEEDHLRRHSSYLADNAGQLVGALAKLGRHLVLTLILLIGPAVVLGFAAGRFYRAIPITRLSLPDHRTTDQATVHLGFRDGVGWALAVAAVFTVLCWLAGEGVAGRRRPDRDNWWHRLFAAAERLGIALGLVILLVAVALPALIWFCSGVLHRTPTPVNVASPIGAVLLTYAAGLASVAWRKRSLLRPKDKAKSAKPGPAAGAPRGFLQVLLVITALFVLGAGWLLIFGGIATVGLEPHLGSSTIGILVAIIVLAVFLGGFTDETTLSMHPFYRARLASAFAVRRIRTPDGLAVAQAYPPAERTVLSRYGRLATPTAFPHIVFAASATVGQQSTAPGDDRVSYTMCADWIGGPDVGYVRTSALERIASPRLKRDLTVQAAVAISGAAIASSVGGQGTKWYETLLAISGLRLGAWLPNPTFVARQYTHPRSVDRPGLPRIRRASYLLRELFGGHPAGGPLLQVTDGGFYDNLGLIELLRRGCSRIYVIDASGDTPPAAQTLGQTLIAAYQELGVVTTLDRTTWSTLTPGSAAPLSPKDPLAGLSARLSAKGLITGSFRYPDSSPYLDEQGRGRTGRLVVAKASLWPELEYQMLAYAMSQAVFPHDSTADQFFDEGQYAGYTQLGRDLGQAAAAVLNQPPPPRSRWFRLRAAARSRRR